MTRYGPAGYTVAGIALVLVILDSVLPFRQPIGAGVADAAETTQQARDYAVAVNKAIPDDCGILQLPYMAYPENGPLEPDLNDYDHFWPAITNPGKRWSYGAVKYTDASVWASQLPQTPTDTQLATLREAGFCGIHIDARGFKGDGFQAVSDDLAERLGPAVATGHEDQWRMFSLTDHAPVSDPSGWPVALKKAFSPPMITTDTATIAPRGSQLGLTWWWTIAPESTFTLTPISPQAPLVSVSGALRSGPCGPAPVTATLASGNQSAAVTIDATAKVSTPFELRLAEPTTSPATLTITTAGGGCPVSDFPYPQFAQVIDLTPHVG